MKRITENQYKELNKRIIKLYGIKKVIMNHREALNELLINTRILDNDINTIKTKVFKIENRLKRRRKRK